MKPKFNCSASRALLTAIAIALTPSLHAATYYWDINDTTPGAGGSTPSGTWDTGGTTWTTDPLGASAVVAVTTTTSDDLFFSAGLTNIGTYTISLADTQNAKSLTFEDGTATISGADGIINLGGTGNVMVNGGLTAVIGANTSTKISGSSGLTKLGVGVLTLNGNDVNTFTGGLNVNAGTLSLLYQNLATPTDLINAGNALNFNGGILSATGKSTGTSSQTLGAVSVNAGGGVLFGNKNGGTALNLVLETLSTSTAGGSLVLGAGGTGANLPVITTTTDKDLQNVYGGRVVWFNGTANTGYDWATTTSVSSPYTISALVTGSYTALTTSAGTDTANSRITANTTLAGSRATNSLKIENPAATQALTLGANLLTLSNGGLLSTGTNAFSINGTAGATRLTAGNGSGSYDLIVHQYNTGGLTIAAVIGDNGANPVNLVKAGTGILFLTGTNTYTGSTYVNQGVLDFGSTTPSGSGANVFVAPGAIVKFNTPTQALIDRIAITNEEIGIRIGSTANNFSFAALPNAFLSNWAGNGAKMDYSGTLTPAADAYRLGFTAQGGLLGITGTAPMTGTQGLIVGGGSVELVGPKTFSGNTFVRNGARLGIAATTGDAGVAYCLQNSALDTGTTANTGTIWFESILFSGAPITGAVFTNSAVFGGLIGSRNLASVYSTTTGANNGAATAVGFITGFTLNTGAGKTHSYSGVISNFATGTTITKTGDGTQVFAGANTYTGNTTVGGGTLNLANQNALQSSTLVMNGGTAALAFDSSVGSNTFALGGLSAAAAGAGYDIALQNNAPVPDAITLIAGGNNASTTYAGALSGTGNLTKAGIGTLTLSGANTYSGTTTINTGTLVVDLSTGSLSSTSDLVMGGGTLQLTGTGSLTLDGLTTTANTSSGIVLAANQTLTLGSLLSAGSGSTLNFNTAAGGADANTSTVGTSVVVLTGQTAGVAINSGFTVTDSTGFGLATVNGSNQVVRLTAGLNLLPASGSSSTLDYLIDNNAGGPTAPGSSSLVLTGSQSTQSITVNTTVASGVLDLDGFTLSNNVWNFGGSGSNTFQVTGDSLSSVLLDETVTINNYNTGTITIASPIVANGTNNVVFNGTGTTVLSGLNTYTGNSFINGGMVNLGVAETVNVNGPLGARAANATGSIVFSGGTLQYSAANTNDYSGRISNAASQPIRIDTNGQTVIFGTALTGSGSTLTKLGTGTLVLNATSTYTGSTIINGGTLRIGNGGTAGALAPASSIINDGVLAFNRTDALTQGTNFGGISGTGSVAINSGTVTLNAVNTFGGGIVLNGATLAAAIDSNLGASSGGITVNASSNFSGGTATYARSILLNNSSFLTFTANVSTTFSGNVTGTGGLAQNSGFGQQTLFTGTANTFEGEIRIGSTGTGSQAYRMLFASLADSATANGKISFLARSVSHAEGSVFEYTGTSNLVLGNRQIEIASSGATPTNGHQIRSNGTGTITVNTNLSVTSTTAQTLTLRGSNTGANAFSTNITNGSSSALSVTKVDAGNWALNGAANTFTGAITFNTTTTSAGTLSYASAGGANAITFNQTTGSATLAYTGAGQTMSGAITAGALTTGTITLSSSGAGAINYSNTGSLGSTTSGIKNLILAGTNENANTLAGQWVNNTGAAATLTKNGSGTWVLTNSNSYTGITNVNVGKLFINGSQSSATGNVNVSAGATLGGTGTTGGNVTVADTGKLEFNIGFPSHDSFDLIATKTLTFTATSELTITASMGVTTGSYVLVTAPGGVIGDVPATLNLPSGWVANVTKESADTQLVLNVTSVGGDTTAPNLVSITDNFSGVPFNIGQTITYTVTFDEDIDAASVSAADFNNNGTALITIGAITETSPTSGVFTVAVTATSPGTLRLRIPVGAVIEDLAMNDLVVPVEDDTTITVRNAYQTWALTNAISSAPGQDKDGDGVNNAIEFLLGGNVATNDLSKLPKITMTATHMIITFERIRSSIDGVTGLEIEVGTTLTGWPDSFTVGTTTANSDAGVTVLENSPSGFDTITLTVPKGTDPKKFARLNVTVTE